MANLKGPAEGGSGGKKGHSNMEHWEYTEVIKVETKSLRRNNAKKEIRDELKNFPQNKS